MHWCGQRFLLSDASVGSTVPTNIEIAVLFAAVAGLASHLLYFIRGEHHMNAPTLFYAYISLALGILLCQLYISEYPYAQAVQNTTAITGAYALSLFTSITIYRTCFHRLHSFPGPFLARVSKLWHVYHVRHSQNHLLLHSLHKKYGSFVRTGPSEITIFEPEALPALDGPKSTCTKPAWYDLLQPQRSVVNIRDKHEHDVRRRIWDRGFNTKSLLDYDDRIIKYGADLLHNIAATSGHPVHANEEFHWFSLDVIGDLALAKSFNMLVDKKWHHAILLMNDFMWLLGPFSPVPWLARIGICLPGMARGWNNFVKWCKDRMEDRILIEPRKPDISSHLIHASLSQNTLSADRPWLNGDAMTMLVAGSDTVATTLTYLFYHLARSTNYQYQIRQEAAELASNLDIASLQKLPILQSIISETLRLHPPLPTGGPRETGPDGLYVEGTYIPPLTTVVAPRYSIARLEQAFPHATHFIPERWTTSPSLILDKRAYAPFSLGRYGCVGKNLALREISYVVALVLSKYHVGFAPGEDGVRVERDMKDAFTAEPGRLELVFELKEKQGA